MLQLMCHILYTTLLFYALCGNEGHIEQFVGLTFLNLNNNLDNKLGVVIAKLTYFAIFGGMRRYDAAKYFQ